MDIQQSVCAEVAHVAAKRRGQVEAVSLIVDLSMVPEEFQTVEVATLAAPQHGRVFFPWLRLGEAVYVESLGEGRFEAAVVIRSPRPTEVMDLSKAAR